MQAKWGTGSIGGDGNGRSLTVRVTISPMKRYTLPIIMERDADGFFVSCPALQGCYTQGTNYDEAIANIKDAIRLHLEDRQADHEELVEEKSVSFSTVDVSI